MATHAGAFPALFPGMTEYVFQLLAVVGVPVIVHVSGDRDRPPGREGVDISGQDDTAVPPVQVRMIG